MRKQLRLVNRMQPVFTFGLDHNSAFHDQVSSEAAIKFYIFVDERHRFLAFNFQTQLLQFVSQAGLVRGLQQSGSQLSMDLDRGADDFAGQVVARQGKRLRQRSQSNRKGRKENQLRIPFWVS